MDGFTCKLFLRLTCFVSEYKIANISNLSQIYQCLRCFKLFKYFKVPKTTYPSSKQSNICIGRESWKDLCKASDKGTHVNLWKINLKWKKSVWIIIYPVISSNNIFWKKSKTLYSGGSRNSEESKKHESARPLKLSWSMFTVAGVAGAGARWWPFAAHTAPFIFHYTYHCNHRLQWHYI